MSYCYNISYDVIYHVLWDAILCYAICYIILCYVVLRNVMMLFTLQMGVQTLCLPVTMADVFIEVWCVTL